MNHYICLILVGLALMAGAVLAARMTVNTYFKAKFAFTTRVIVAFAKVFEEITKKTEGGKHE